MQGDKESREPLAPKKGIDRRLIYILPSILALCIALVTCLFVFRSYIFDLQNIRYDVYVEADQTNPSTDTDEECLALINQVMSDCGTTGFTVNKSLEGAFIDDTGKLETQVSYQVLFMDIGKEQASEIVSALREAFSTDVVLVESTVTSSYYSTARGNFDSVSEVMGK